MIIQLREGWRAKSDSVGWQVQRSVIAGKSSKNPGEVLWVTSGYYGSIDACLKGAVEHILMNDDSTLDISQVAEKVNEVRDIVAERLGLGR